jgi:hypothetical protein
VASRFGGRVVGAHWMPSWSASWLLSERFSAVNGHQENGSGALSVTQVAGVACGVRIAAFVIMTGVRS